MIGSRRQPGPLKVHKYVVRVVVASKKKVSEKYHYCHELSEIRNIRKKAKAGSVIEVWKAAHSFWDSWACV